MCIMDLCQNISQSAYYKCTLCDKTFAKKYNMDRHTKHVHGLEQHKEKIGKNCCNVCKKKFTRRTTLRRHIDEIHKLPGLCLECYKIFSDVKSLCQHIRIEHDQRDNPLREYCTLCVGNFSNKSNLLKHMRKVHQVENEYKSRAFLGCPLCDTTFNSTSRLHSHIQIEHDVHLETVSKVFESVDEFKKWKSDMEKEDLTLFTIHRVNGNRSYYGCHRSGSSRITGSGKRPKLSNSKKIGSRCPAQIKVTNIEGRITVDYCKTHVGHSKTIQFLDLTKEERDQLAGKIKIGMTFNQILDEIHESIAPSDNIHRLHLVEKRDLYNIVRDYKLDKYVVHK